MSERGRLTGRPARRSWIDVTLPVRKSMVQWPGDPPVHIERTMDLERGDACNASSISMGSHTGTHMDAPLHFLKGAPGIDAMPLTVGIGRARVIETGAGRRIEADELHRHRIRRGERILLKTPNTPRCWESDGFVKDFVFLSKEAARFLADRGVLLVGVDYFSVGGYKDRESVETHMTLLEAGVWIIEGLNLTGVGPGKYDLVCLPLRLDACDGSPVRVVLRPL